MNTLITIISMVLFVVLGIIIYNILNGMDSKNKIIIFFSEIIICLIFTTILFNMSSLGIEYPNSKSKEIAMRTLVLIFTPINGILLLPNITRIMNERQNDKINKEEYTKKLQKFFIIIVLLIIIEFIYLKNIQIGILSNYNIQKWL